MHSEDKGTISYKLNFHYEDPNYVHYMDDQAKRAISSHSGITNRKVCDLDSNQSLGSTK